MVFHLDRQHSLHDDCENGEFMFVPTRGLAGRDGHFRDRYLVVLEGGIDDPLANEGGISLEYRFNADIPTVLRLSRRAQQNEAKCQNECFHLSFRGCIQESESSQPIRN